MQAQLRDSVIQMAALVYPHDVGYKQDAGSIDARDIPRALWELQMHAALIILEDAQPPLMTDEELRRGIEALDRHTYDEWSELL